MAAKVQELNRNLKNDAVFDLPFNKLQINRDLKDRPDHSELVKKGIDSILMYFITIIRSS